MNPQALMNYEVRPPIEYAIGVCMIVTAICLVTKARMQSRGGLGWEYRSSRTRFLQRSVALFFIVRGLTIFDGHPVNFWVIFLSVSMMGLQVNDLIEYARRSKRTCHANVGIDELFSLPSGAGLQR